MAGCPVCSNLAYSSLAQGDGRENEKRRLFVCKCGDCAHDREEKREQATERKREFGVCAVGPVSRISAVLARDKTTCM